MPAPPVEPVEVVFDLRERGFPGQVVLYSGNLYRWEEDEAGRTGWRGIDEARGVAPNQSVARMTSSLLRPATAAYPSYWTRDQAIELCTKIEAFAPRFGFHVALTGGLLYKRGARKDADILFYEIRGSEKHDYEGLLDALQSIGIVLGDDYGFIHKASYRGRNIDFMLPERVYDLATLPALDGHDIERYGLPSRLRSPPTNVVSYDELDADL